MGLNCQHDDRDLAEVLELEEGYSRALASIPRMRFQEAKALAEGMILDGCDRSSGLSVCHDEEQQDADGGAPRGLGDLDPPEWARLEELNKQSEEILADMDTVLETLQQWRKHREKSPSELNARPHRSGNPQDTCPRASLGEQGSAGSDDHGDRGSHDLALSQEGIPDCAQEPLTVLWKEGQLRAEQAAGRLQKHLGGSLKNQRLAETAAAGDRANLCRHAPPELAHTLHHLAKESMDNRTADLCREVDELEVQKWIDDVRAQEGENATAKAHDACEDIWRRTKSVDEIERGLNRFAEDLDEVLSRLDGSRNAHEQHGEHHHTNVMSAEARQLDERAPVADSQVLNGT